MTPSMWHDKQRNVLVYDTPEADKLAQYVPGSVRLQNGYVACPVSLYNLQLLRFLQHPVIPPMEGNYDWPRSPFIKQPFEAQTVTANFLVLHPRAFCLSDMGTGKTLAALWAADYLMRQYEHAGPMRALIVAPLSTLQRVWSDAIFANLMGKRRAVVLHGSAARRRQLLAQPFDFYIINFDGLGVLAKELAVRPDIRICIVDEASSYRDPSTERHKIARKILLPRDYLWLMTGTPTPNGPTDAFGLAKLVNNAFGESLTGYKMRVMTKVTAFKWVPRQGAHIEASKMLQPAVRFHIKDCLDLPPCTTQQREVELSPEQAKAYKIMQRECVLLMKSGKPITAANEAVVRLKLIQISCGAVYSADREVHLVDAKPRLTITKEVLDQSTGKIIVFAPLTSVLKLLYNELKDYTRAIINGQVSQKERGEIFRAFQESDKPHVLIADPATMAHGLTLTKASTILWYAPTDRTELYLQANKRIDRPGQTLPTTIVQLAATPLEREIYKRLESNASMQGLILKIARGEV